MNSILDDILINKDRVNSILNTLYNKYSNDLGYSAFIDYLSERSGELFELLEIFCKIVDKAKIDTKIGA